MTRRQPKMYPWTILVFIIVVAHCKPQHGQIEAAATYDLKIEEDMPKVSILPFYGGHKGQSLQIVEKPDGTVTTYIIKTPDTTTQRPPEEVDEETINPAELENPDLPSKQDLNFGPNLRNIHRTALNIISLQELLKKNGKLTSEDEEDYKKNWDSLNMSADNLAQLQSEEPEDREGLMQWFENKRNNMIDKEKGKEENKTKKEEQGVDKTTTQKPKEEEGEEEEGGVGEEDNDGVSIGLPAEDASVAEAKPVGLAIAGEGGVAASKPIATAVVGPGGLAIARPVGTAIAGVAPDQALVPIYAEGYVSPTKPKRYNNGTKKDNRDQDSASHFLSKLINKYHQLK